MSVLANVAIEVYGVYMLSSLKQPTSRMQLLMSLCRKLPLLQLPRHPLLQVTAATAIIEA